MLPSRSKLSVAVFLTPPLLLYGAAVLLPIVQSLVLSFFTWDGISGLHFAGLSNYTFMLTEGDFWTAVTNQLGYLVVCLVLQLGGGLFVACLLLSLTRGREVVKVLFLLPAVISTVAIALLFQRIYSADPAGPLNRLLDLAGLGVLERPWLSDVHTVLAAVSAPEGWRFIGLYTVILYAALLTVPKELEEAARLDGANQWQVFTRIRFPHIRPVWLTTSIMAVTYAMRGFDIPYLLTGGGPGQSSELVTTYMYKTAFLSTDFGYAAAMSVFIVVESLVAVGLIVFLLRRKAA